MPEPRTPAKPKINKPGEMRPDLPETEAPEEEFLEGQLPGMPLSRDPLREPGPTPPMKEKPPLD